MAIVPMRFVFFPLDVSEVLNLPRKSEAKSYEVLHSAAAKCSPSQEISARTAEHV